MARGGDDEEKRKLWATRVHSKLVELKQPLSDWQKNLALAKLKAEHGSPEADRGKALAELEAVKDEGEELIVRLLALLARGPPLRSVSLLTQPNEALTLTCVVCV